MNTRYSMPEMCMTCIIMIACVVSPAFAVASPETVPPPFQATGSLHVDGSPVGMEVALDGRVAGQVPGSGVLVLERIPVGEHTVSAYLEGYEPKEMLVNVPDGLPAEVRVTLERETAGTIEIDSAPPNVQVYVDDLYKGITPVTLTGIPVGSHMVLLRLSGYQDWSSSVDVTPDQSVSVSGTLVPLQGTPVPTPQSGPGVLITGILAGIGCIIAAGIRGRGCTGDIRGDNER